MCLQASEDTRTRTRTRTRTHAHTHTHTRSRHGCLLASEDELHKVTQTRRSHAGVFAGEATAAAPGTVGTALHDPAEFSRTNKKQEPVSAEGPAQSPEMSGQAQALPLFLREIDGFRTRWAQDGALADESFDVDDPAEFSCTNKKHEQLQDESHDVQSSGEKDSLCA